MSNLPNFTKPQVGVSNGSERPGDAKEEKEQPEITPAAPGASEGQVPESDLSTVAFWQQEAKKARKEAENVRANAKETARKLEALERAKLEEQGQYQRLYEQAKVDLEAKQQEIEAGGAYRTAFEDMLHKRIEAIPEAMRGLVPTDYEPLRLAQWLDANAERLGARRFPNLDAGAGGPSGSGGTGKKPDPVAADLARKLGIDPAKLTSP